MWLYGERYARSSLSAVEFYKHLPPFDRDMADRLAQGIIAAYQATNGKSSSGANRAKRKASGVTP